MAERALLLDFDGTLANSLPALRRVYEAFVVKLGGEATTEEFDALNGPPLREVVERLSFTHRGCGQFPDDLTFYRQLIAEESALIPPTAGASELLDEAATRGIRCAIVTSGKSDLVEPWLRSAGFNVDAIVAADDTEEHKPSPAPYLEALRRLGVEPVDALAIEDSPAGVQSAAAAGITTLRLSAVPVASGREKAVIATLAEALPYLDLLTDR